MKQETSSASNSGGVVKHDPQASVRAVTAACIGNVMEWYDFSMYAFYAMYIASNFFGNKDPGVQLVEAFMAFGLGYVIRPVGAVILGAYGDKKGRKPVLMLTIFLMAVELNFWLVAVLTAALAGSALGFLYFNFSPAKIFMGDTGSMFLG